MLQMHNNFIPNFTNFVIKIWDFPIALLGIIVYNCG
jgi:hypothetical protein